MDGARKTLIPLALLLAGCHGSEDAPYRDFAPAPTRHAPSPASGDAFDADLLAARETEAAVAPFKADPLHRTFFTPQQRRDLLKALAPALRRVEAARGPCDFRYDPVPPGASQPGRAAWRLLGRAMRWRIDDALAGDSAQNAVTASAVAFRFANDLCGGGPADRTLGVEIANDARQAILPALARLDPPGLHRLADAVKAGLVRRPSVDKTLANADGDMRLALQALQDAYRKDDYAALRKDMGKDFRDVESSLRDLSGRKRAAFFDALDAERARISALARAAAALPAARRTDLMGLRLQGDRPRRTFVRHYFLVARPLLEIEDRSVAQLRLLVLEAELRRVARLTGRAPAGLAKVSAPWATDPYDGRTFGYQPDGREFRVYSVGANLKDDLGDTDAAGLDPDIRTIVP